MDFIFLLRSCLGLCRKPLRDYRKEPASRAPNLRHCAQNSARVRKLSRVGPMRTGLLRSGQSKTRSKLCASLYKPRGRQDSEIEITEDTQWAVVVDAVAELSAQTMSQTHVASFRASKSTLEFISIFIHFIYRCFIPLVPGSPVEATSRRHTAGATRDLSPPTATEVVTDAAKAAHTSHQPESATSSAYEALFMPTKPLNYE